MGVAAGVLSSSESLSKAVYTHVSEAVGMVSKKKEKENKK